MSLMDNLKRGSVELLLLTLLQEKDMYGYQLSQELLQRSSGRYQLLESSMYPILYRMIDKGYISDRRELVGRRRFRVYYHIEEEGKQYLAYGESQIRFVFSGILNLMDGKD